MAADNGKTTNEHMYGKAQTVSAEIIGEEAVSTMEFLKAAKEACGSVVGCRLLGADKYEVTMGSTSAKQRMMDGFKIKGNRVVAKDLQGDELVVSFLNLPVYTSDDELRAKLAGWGVRIISPIKRRYWPGTDVADGTRYMKVKFNDKVVSLPYSAKFETAEGASYFRVIHDRQVKVCRLCIQPGHILRDCPEFRCHRCSMQGHYARECAQGKERGGDGGEGRSHETSEQEQKEGGEEQQGGEEQEERPDGEPHSCSEEDGSGEEGEDDDDEDDDDDMEEEEEVMEEDGKKGREGEVEAEKEKEAGDETGRNGSSVDRDQGDMSEGKREEDGGGVKKGQESGMTRGRNDDKEKEEGNAAGKGQAGEKRGEEIMIQDTDGNTMMEIMANRKRPGGRKEARDDQNECQVNNGGCSHRCVDQPLGFHCDCPDHMRLVEDSQCEEVDACLESDVCDQLCVHTNGSLSCDCNKDYQMNPTTRECKAKGNEAQLVFTSSEGIRWISITGSEYRKPAPHLPGPGPVAALASNRTLYWARQGRGSVYRVSVDGKTEDSVLVLKFQGSASGLAVDWIHQLLYWTSMESGSVNVGLLDGSAQRQLITGLDKPSAVAVDPLQGLLFWAQCGNSPKIERASLDGRDRMALVISSLRQPVAISLDIPRQLLYWVDQGMRSISRVNLEGRHRKTVVESNGYLDRPFGLAVFEGFVYWSEEVTRSICRASKHNGGNLQVLLSNVTSPGGVVLIQPVLQPKGPSECGHPGTACERGCVVDLLTESLEFSCTPSDATFAGILSLIVFLSVLLVGMALWWWREEFRSSRSLTEQSFSLKESQDPLIIQGPCVGPNTRLVNETPLKLDLDSE